jgi:hypothetical protein
VDRLNSLSYPAGYLNDLNRAFQWISTPGVNSVNITITLTNSLYEVEGEVREGRKGEGGRE